LTVLASIAFAVITAVLDPAPTLSGNCNPTRVHFTGHITSDTPGKVTYTWVRLNQPAGRTITADFDKPGAVTVTYDLLIHKAEDGAVMLRVLLPQQSDSAKVKFHVSCK